MKKGLRGAAAAFDLKAIRERRAALAGWPSRCGFRASLSSWCFLQACLLRQTLEELGMTESETLTPPVLRDPEAAAWCSFCDTEYRAGFAACSDCSLPFHSLQDIL